MNKRNHVGVGILCSALRFKQKDDILQSCEKAPLPGEGLQEEARPGDPFKSLDIIQITVNAGCLGWQGQKY